MPETVKRDYTGQSKSQPVNSIGPKKGSNGPTKWPGKTRGAMVNDKTSPWPCHATTKAQTPTKKFGSR